MDDKKEKRRRSQEIEKEIQEKKIEEMEQDEVFNCTISKDSNHISNYDLVIQKERTKNGYRQMRNRANDSSQK